MPRKYKVFREDYIGLQPELRSRVGVSWVERENDKVETFDGVWDTGATNSAITEKVVEKLGLKPVDVVETSTANGIRMSKVYIVKLTLEGDIVKYVHATECDMKDLDVLIGMDVIGTGDFAVSTTNSGDMHLEYRTPSQGVVKL